MFLVLFILHDSDKLGSLLDAWEAAGVSGVTIMHSTGLGRARQGIGWRDDLPLMPSLKSLFQTEEVYSRTLFTVVPNQLLVDRVVAATIDVIGDLERPETGLLVVLPLVAAYGLQKKRGEREQRKI
jgi:hypothetical protein